MAASSPFETQAAQIVDADIEPDARARLGIHESWFCPLRPSRPTSRWRSYLPVNDQEETDEQLDVGALPICGDDDRLKGMVTDRDIVVKCIARGDDPKSVTAGSMGEGKPVTIGADDSVDEFFRR